MFEKKGNERERRVRAKSRARYTSDDESRAISLRVKLPDFSEFFSINTCILHHLFVQWKNCVNNI